MRSLVLSAIVIASLGGCAYYERYPAYPAPYSATTYQPETTVVASAPASATAYYTTSGGTYYVAPSPYYPDRYVYVGGPSVSIGGFVPFGFHTRFRHFRGRW